MSPHVVPHPPNGHNGHGAIRQAGDAAGEAGGGALGAEFTKTVIASMGPNASPRLREVLAALIRHVHDFARDVQLTTDEWMAGVQMINWAGRMSDSKRDEGQLLCDVIGLESLVDDITSNAAAKTGHTASAILGPFWRADAPARANGSSISFDPPADAQPVLMRGTVTSSNGLALANATVDVWQASTNGLYEQQDPQQREHNLRGVFMTDARGRYSFYCIRPTAYPIPRDGPAGRLLDLMDRHVYRPAHIHLRVCADGHETLVTQIFDRDGKYLTDDAVFAVKDELKVRFVPLQGDERADLALEYDIKLARTS